MRDDVMRLRSSSLWEGQPPGRASPRTAPLKSTLVDQYLSFQSRCLPLHPLQTSSIPSFFRELSRRVNASLLDSIVLNIASSILAPLARWSSVLFAIMDTPASVKSASKLGSSVSSGTKRKRATEPKFYGVRIGHQPGIYSTWADCLQNTKGFKKPECMHLIASMLSFC